MVDYERILLAAKAFGVLQYLVERANQLVIVVNNAGYFPNRSIDQLDLPTLRKTMATNLDSHFLSAKYFVPAMRKKRWGRLVGISSNMVAALFKDWVEY